MLLHFYSALGERHVEVSQAHLDSMALAGGLRHLGIGKGDVVAVQMPTCYETLLTYLAILHTGATLLPVIHIYGATELQFVLQQSKAKALIIPDRWHKLDFVERWRNAQPLPDLQHLIVFGDDMPVGATPLRDLLQGDPADIELPGGIADCGADDVCLLLYTSGTTSAPKGVQHTHNTLRAEWQDYEYDAPAYIKTGPFLNTFPAGHIGGFLYFTRPIYQGIPSVFLDQWDAHQAARLIEQHKVEHTGGPQYFLTTLMQAIEAQPYDISSLTAFGMGAAGITPASIELTDRMGFPGGRVYGSSEVPTVTYWTPDMPLQQRANTDGKIASRCEVRIIDDTCNDLPVGEAGEIVVRAPEMFVGYLDPQLDIDSFLPGGWFRTGDIGCVDAAGFLTITDRKKDIIIRGGENISSKEVEDAIARHPAIAEVAVVAMPDEKYGERVCAFAMVRRHQTVTLADIQQHFAALGLAKQKCPEFLHVVDDLPRTAGGKVKKFELRQSLRDSVRTTTGRE
ncbi:MAG: AMP-binding protein [Spongiibacteraceae bacterium]